MKWFSISGTVSTGTKMRGDRQKLIHASHGTIWTEWQRVGGLKSLELGQYRAELKEKREEREAGLSQDVLCGSELWKEEGMVSVGEVVYSLLALLTAIQTANRW